MRDYKLTLNLVTNEAPSSKIFKQYDTGNEIELELYQNEHLNPDDKLVLSNESVLAFFKRADGQVLQKSCSIRNGNAIVKTAKDVLGVPGTLELECMVKKGDVETTTTRMTFTVKESIARDGAIEEDPRYTSDLVTELLDVRDNVKAETIGKIEEVATSLEETKNNVENLNVNKAEKTEVTKTINELKDSNDLIYAKKSEVTNCITPKGNSIYAELPKSNNNVGDYYYCNDGDGSNGAGNYVWNGTTWYFGGTGDEGYSILKEELHDFATSRKKLSDYDMIIGNFTVDGELDVSTTRCSTEEYIPIKKGCFLETTNKDVYLSIQVYDKDLKKIQGIPWTNEKTVITQGEFIRVSVRDKDSSIITDELLKTLSDSAIVTLPYEKKDIFQYSCETPLITKVQQYSCFIKNYKIPSFSGYAVQGNAVFNGIIFQVYADNLIALIDYKTGKTIKTLVATTGHGSVIDFSNEYYDENDEFPLAYITGSNNPRQFFVTRITRTGCTRVRTLFLPLEDASYYPIHTLDNVNNILYTLAYKQDSHASYTEGNHMVLVAWDLTKLNRRENGEYTPTVLYKVESPFMPTRQSMCMLPSDRNKLLVMSSPAPAYGIVPNTTIYVINVSDGRIVGVMSDFPSDIKNFEGQSITPVLKDNKYGLLLTTVERKVYNIVFD